MDIYSLGVMTGTSCDSVDLALLVLKNVAGKWHEKLWHTQTKPMPHLLRNRLRVAQTGILTIPQSARLTRDYSLWIAKTCDSFLKKHQVLREQTLIAVHGQTVWHAPPPTHLSSKKPKPIGFSVQLIDPTVVSFITECTVTTNFRQPDLARGGQGAPLVPYYHWLLSQSGFLKNQIPFAIHNIGGIANLTVVTPQLKNIIAFDTGPGNALIDLAVEKMTHGKNHFDPQGNFAASVLSQIYWKKIETLGNQAFFKRKPPKSTGRELFNESFLKKIPGSGKILIANTTALTAYTMAKAYTDFVFPHIKSLSHIFLSGGGAFNQTLIKLFTQELLRLVKKSSQLKRFPWVKLFPGNVAPPKYLEAMAFARLGFEALQGKSVSLASITGACKNGMGAGIFPGKNYCFLLDLFHNTKAL